MVDGLVEELQRRIPGLESQLRSVEGKLVFIEQELARLNDEGRAVVGDLGQRAKRLRDAIAAVGQAIAALSSLEGA